MERPRRDAKAPRTLNEPACCSSSSFRISRAFVSRPKSAASTSTTGVRRMCAPMSPWISRIPFLSIARDMLSRPISRWPDILAEPAAPHGRAPSDSAARTAPGRMPAMAWNGEEELREHDAETGAWIVIAIHSTRLGPAVGGTRMKPYHSPEEAETDARRLSAAMTLKMAASGMPWGGGKAVLAVPEGLTPDARRGLLHRYG